MAPAEGQRQLCAAAHSGPGPDKKLRTLVGHNEHCLSKKCYPAYSFAGTGINFNTSCSPGTKYWLTPGLTRHGKAGPPCYSLAARLNDQGSDNNPASCTYSPDKGDRQKFRCAPCYSLAATTKQAKSDAVPAPNCYSLPACMGAKCVDKSSAANYSLVGRSGVGGFAEDLKKTPGPGAYKTPTTEMFKHRSPSYHLIGKGSDYGNYNKDITPGPSSYFHSQVSPKKSFPLEKLTTHIPS